MTKCTQKCQQNFFSGSGWPTIVYLKHEHLVRLSPYLESKEHFDKCPVLQEEKQRMIVDHSHDTFLVRKCHQDYISSQSLDHFLPEHFLNVALLAIAPVTVQEE